MKKLFLSFIILCIPLITISQNAETNLKKYWYLRWRLKHYFMVVGEGPGMSLPMGTRNRTLPNPTHDCNNTPTTNANRLWNSGDVPNHLGSYIGVLATEYKLLHDAGQNTNETLSELYFALLAINRLDNCEGTYPWNGFPNTTTNNAAPIVHANSLDGLCSRNDMPVDFVPQHFEELNANLNQFSPAVNPGDPELISTGGSVNCPLYVDDPIHNSESLLDDQEQGLFSQDHISSIMVGLALVKKFIPDGTIINGLNLHAESANIVHRLFGYMKQNTWYLHNPNGSAIVYGRGSWAWFLSYGFSRAAAYIDPANSNEYLTDGTANTFFSVWNDIGVLYGLADICALPFPSTCDATETSWIVMNLAAIGDSWEGAAASVSPIFPACFIPGIECTQALIWAHSFVYDWDAYYPLLHAVLHNTNCISDQPRIEADLNSMPCSGNSNYSPGWASANKYHDVPSQNSYSSDLGKFNGLEYMLLFNLYCIHENGAYVASSDYINKMNNTGLSYYPIGMLHYGSNSIPAHDGVFENMTSASKIYAAHPDAPGHAINGNVEFRAGNSISLEPGFEVFPGATFSAYIDPYECNGSIYSRIADTSDSIDSNINTPNINKKELFGNLSNSFSIHPNPTSNKVQLKYSVHQQGTTTIRITNILGELISQISTPCPPPAGENNRPGTYETIFDASTLAPGIYFCIFEAGDYREVKKLVKIENR